MQKRPGSEPFLRSSTECDIPSSFSRTGSCSSRPTRTFGARNDHQTPSSSHRMIFRVVFLTRVALTPPPPFLSIASRSHSQPTLSNPLCWRLLWRRGSFNRLWRQFAWNRFGHRRQHQTTIFNRHAFTVFEVQSEDSRPLASGPACQGMRRPPPLLELPEFMGKSARDIELGIKVVIGKGRTGMWEKDASKFSRVSRKRETRLR